MTKQTKLKINTNWLYIVILAILFIAIGFFTYQWMQAKISLTETTGIINTLQQQIEDQKNEIKELKKEISDLKTSLGSKTYTNKLFGFEFDYPEDYSFKESDPVTPTFILLGKKTDQKTIWLVEVSVNPDTDYASFNEYVVNLARNHCAADGPMGSVYCTDIIQQKPLMNKNDISGYEIYITEVFDFYQENERKIEEKMRGPIFIFELSQKDFFRAIYFELTGTARHSDEASDLEVILRDMVDSLNFNE